MNMTRSRELVVVGESETAELAADIASLVEEGDVIAMSGDLGSGKTTFARAFLREWGVQEEVPSPTFTLVQTYELEAGTIWHFDFYRLEKPEDALELDDLLSLERFRLPHQLALSLRKLAAEARGKLDPGNGGVRRPVIT